MVHACLRSITLGFVLLAICTGGFSDDFAARRPALGLPGSGGMVNPEGTFDLTGASHINIPLAYTIHAKQHQWGIYWGDEAKPGDIGEILSLSVGSSKPGSGLSLTALHIGSEGFSGAVQKQLWRETGKWPAMAVGLYDVTDRVDRGGYVVATRRLGGRQPTGLQVWWPPEQVSVVSADDPRTWGQLILNHHAASAQVEPARPLLEAPEVTSPPHLDGVIGVGEWELAGAQVYHFAPGEEMIVMAAYDEYNLYVCLSVPSDHGFGPGYGATLLLEVPQQGAAIVDRHHYRYQVEVTHTGQVARSFCQGQEGTWGAPVASSEGESMFSAAASAGGDGAWRWPVFELAVPLSNLDGDGEKKALGFAVGVTLPAGGTYWGGAEKWVDLVRFPADRSSYRSPYNQVFPTRPDLWGTAVFEDTASTNGSVPISVITDEVKVDGQLNEPAWEQAPAATYTVFRNSTQTVRVLADDHTLYVGVRCAISRGQQTHRSCQVYVDALGDEGLLPRADDRLYHFDAADDTYRCMRWQNDSWSQPTPSRFQAAAHSAPVGQQMVDSYEFAIPLRELARPSGEANIGLAVQTRYEAHPAPRQVQRGPARAYLTAGWGGGPFSGHGFGGLSLRIGQRGRGIVEYDGAGVNVGYVTRPAGTKYNLMLGIANLAGPHDNQITIAISQQSQF